MPSYPHPVELALNIYDNLGEPAMLAYLQQAATTASRPQEGRADTEYHLLPTGQIRHQPDSYTFAVRPAGEAPPSVRWNTTTITPNSATRPARVPPEQSPAAHIEVIPLLTGLSSQSIWDRIHETLVQDALNIIPECYLLAEEVDLDLLHPDHYASSSALHQQVNQQVRNYEPSEWANNIVSIDEEYIARKALAQLTPEQTRQVEKAAAQAARARLAEEDQEQQETS